MSSLPHIMLLHSGGLRSLIATAGVLHRPGRSRLTLLHIDDGRDAGQQRLEHARQQADHYGLKRLIILELPHLYRPPTHRQPDGRPRTTLGTEQMLLAALGAARDQQADELVWPLSENSQPDVIAIAHTRQLLASEMLDLADPPAAGRATVSLTMPLLDHSDQQLIEAGAGLGVPWDAAWSCLLNQPLPCGACPACRRRVAAFRAAAVIDTALHPELQR